MDTYICVAAYIDLYLLMCTGVHIITFIMYIVKHIYIYQLVTCAAITSTKEAANGRNLIKIYQEEIGSKT